MSIQKIIGSLHIRNHKDPSCQESYSPANLKKELLEGYTMAVEKTFGWLSRFKKIVCAMPPSSIAREVRARCSLALGSSLDFLEKENVFPFPPRLENVADPPRNRPSETVVVEVNYHKSTRMVAYDGSRQENLVKYVTRKDWKAVINILFKMKEVKAALPGAFQAIVSQEVKEYCNSMNVLKKTSPEELVTLSNVSIVEELENHCPLRSASA